MDEKIILKNLREKLMSSVFILLPQTPEEKHYNHGLVVQACNDLAMELRGYCDVSITAEEIYNIYQAHQHELVTES